MTGQPHAAVVVGGGLAGAAAALVLAERGVVTRLVRSGPGSTALSWGSLDVAGASPDPVGLPWRDPVRSHPLSPGERLAYLLNARRAHPYGALFPERDAGRAVRAVKEATAALDAWLRPAGAGLEGSLDESRLLANVRGAVRVSDFAMVEAAAGDLGRAAGVVLGDVPGLSGFSAPAVARALGAELAALGVPCPPIRVVRLELPEGLQSLAARPARLAAALDDPAATAELARSVRGQAAEGRTLLLPPILGLSRTHSVCRALCEQAGGPVAELLGAPPWSPAGLRLDRALGAALERAGVEVRTARASGLRGDLGRIARVELEGEAALEADAVVLATGRFVGGGLSERDDAVVESLAGLPVFDDRGRRLDGRPGRGQLRRRYADPQPLFGAGVRTDGRLRPLGPDQHPLWSNLVAAGEILGGFDPALQRTGLGVALLSGVRAGEEAAHLAGEALR
ncbi:MAG: FAD-binding protein [Deltaproteobacteria bacterium]|nr:FAD-binding protein [Deltaproteobacteria bacterium]